MENKGSELIDVKIELEEDQLGYLKEHNIDINELANEYIKELFSENTLNRMRLEALKLKQSIRADTERLEQIEEEIKALEMGIKRRN